MCNLIYINDILLIRLLIYKCIKGSRTEYPNVTFSGYQNLIMDNLLILRIWM